MKRKIVANVGSYKDKNGNEKKQWQNVGTLMQNDRGFYILLDSFFNPAALRVGNDKSIILSVFEEDDDSQPSNKTRPRGPKQGQEQKSRAQSYQDIDDELPF